MTKNIFPGWQDFKRELLARWSEIKEDDILRIKPERHSIIELLERRVGMKFEEASQSFEEMASRFHLYEEPHYTEPPVKEKKEKVLELNPRKDTKRKNSA